MYSTLTFIFGYGNFYLYYKNEKLVMGNATTVLVITCTSCQVGLPFHFERLLCQ
jgi:hypothetical protein